MRIYLYLRTFPRLGTPINGGLNKAVHGLACGLASAGADVTILCEGRVTARTEPGSGYDIRCFANRTRPSSFTVSSELKKFIDEEMEPGLVVLNGIFMPAVALISRLLQKKGIRYIAAPHDPYHPEIFRKKWYVKWPYWHLLERPMLRKATAVQVLDEGHRDFLRTLDVSTTVISLPNGYLPIEAEREPTLPDGGDPRLLFLGRMDSHNKGLDLLLSAFAKLGLEGRAKLTLQGPNTADRDSLEKQAKSLKRQNQISFVDVDYTRPSSEVISGHHVFCLPSRFEGFGLAALEAMLAGRPVLVSCVAGIAPHVGRCGGGVVVHADVNSIHDGLVELLLRRDEWAEMGRRGREYALKHLNWGRIGERALREYRRVCKEVTAAPQWPLVDRKPAQFTRFSDVKNYETTTARSEFLPVARPADVVLRDA